MLNAFMNYLKNPNLMECILPHFGVTAIALINKSHTHEVDHLLEVISDCLIRILNNIKNWRLAQSFFK